MKKTRLFLSVSACLLALTSICSADILIDNFEDTTASTSGGLGLLGITAVGGAIPTATGQDGTPMSPIAGVLGGIRSGEVNSIIPSGLVNLAVSDAFDRGRFSEGAGADGTGFFTYDGGGAGLNSGAGVDFSGEAAVVVDVVEFNTGDVNVTLQFIDADGDVFELEGVVDQLGEHSFLIDDFLLAGGAGDGLLDLTSITSFQFGVTNGNGLTAQDIGINSIRTVPTPEPTSLALWGLGLLGAGIAVRRRQRSARK